MTRQISKKPGSIYRSGQFIDRLMAVIAMATILAAYFFGLSRAETDLKPTFQLLYPAAQRFEKISDTLFAAVQREQVIGYIAMGEATGYGGPIYVATSVDLLGVVKEFQVVDQTETYEYFMKVMKSGFPERLIGKSCNDPFDLKQDVDGVSGATYTADAIARAIGKGCRQALANGLGGSTNGASAKIQIGAPEIALVLLFAVGFYGHRAKFKYTRQARWISMIIGLAVLGFWLNRPLTIAHINQLLLGFWPSWQNQLYWYLLIGGILLVIAIDSKNPYCDWFCPFGAAQECLGAVGKAKLRSPGKFREHLKWLQRGLAWLAIILALIFRNPSISSYEVFDSLFARVGSSLSYALLGIVLVASLFIKRPWCTYLCPLHPVTDFLTMLRRWVVELWKKSTN